MGHFKEVLPVIVQETSFSFGPSEDTIITKASPGASPLGGEDDGPEYQRTWLEWAIPEVPGDPLPKPQPPDPLGPQTPRPSPSLPSNPLRASPPPLFLGLPPGCSMQGCGKDPPPHPAGPARGHFPSPRFTFLKC